MRDETVSEVASVLQKRLGQRLVAYVAGSRSSKAVGRWARGEDQPSEPAEKAMRQLYLVVLMLDEASEGDATIRAWFTSKNPELGDEVAADVLRAGDAARVLNAAAAFATA